MGGGICAFEATRGTVGARVGQVTLCLPQAAVVTGLLDSLLLLLLLVLLGLSLVLMIMLLLLMGVMMVLLLLLWWWL